MAGVAIHGSQIHESIKSGYVTYKIERRVEGDYSGYDPITGEGYGWIDEHWVNEGTGSTGAKVTGSVSVSSSKMKLSGKNVATVGDKVNVSWVAYPPIPTSNSLYRYTATSATSGSEQGEIISGSMKGKSQGKDIALIGSTVTTGLGTTTTIKTGNEKMKFGS